MTFYTSRLVIKIPGEGLAEKASRFYLENKEDGERWDAPLPGYFTTLEYQRDVLERDVKGFEDGFETRFWLFLKDDEKTPIGYSLIQKVVRTDYQSSCVIGYFLDARYQKKGYMREALEAILKLLFDDYKMQRIAAYIHPENEASIRLIKDMGFEYEGLTKSYLCLHGRWQDHCCYSKIYSNDNGDGSFCQLLMSKSSPLC